MVVENKVLRRIFELNTKEITRECRKLHNEELHNLYFSTNSGKMRWTMGATYNIYGKDEKCIQKFGRKTSREETTWRS